MSPWLPLLLEPPALATDADFAGWFDRLAARLLGGCRLVAGGAAHRLTEVEFYYFGGAHRDPFAHRDPVQVGTGVWYFHRTGGVYRGGSFKGLDLTFGGPAAFAGALFRGAEHPGGPVIDGPSLLVDHLLRLAGKATVAGLDEAIEGRAAWEADNPLRLEWVDPPEERVSLKAARVGLSMRRLRAGEAPPRFILRRYRYLADPRRTAKGKLHMALALHADGRTPGEIRALTGATNAAITRYVADFNEGAKETDFSRYFGLEMGPRDLARLHGLWHAKFVAQG